MKKLAIFVLVMIMMGAFAAEPVSAQAIDEQLQGASEMALNIVYLVFGECPAGFEGCEESPLQVFLFNYMLPAAFLYFILEDMFLIMGMFTKRTAQALSIIIALFAARAQVFIQIQQMINSVFANMFVSSLSFLFVMMILWWVIAHFFHGYAIAKATQKGYEDIGQGMKGIFSVSNALEEHKYGKK